MPPKRRKLLSDSESDFEQLCSDNEDEESLFLPDPNNSGDDDTDESESEFFGETISNITYCQASKTYTDNQSKLEDNYIFEWIEGEQRYSGDVDNSCRMTDNIKKKLQNMNCIEIFEIFFVMK